MLWTLPCEEMGTKSPLIYFSHNFHSLENSTEDWKCISQSVSSKEIKISNNLQELKIFVKFAKGQKLKLVIISKYFSK